MKEEAFFARIRSRESETAVPHPGTYPTVARTLPGDLAEEFVRQLTAVGGHVYRVENAMAARAQLAAIIADLRARGHGVRQAILSDHPLLHEIDAAGVMGETAVGILKSSAANLQPSADIGVTGAEYAIAASGTIAMAASAAHPRSTSLLPPIHIAIVDENQLLPDLAAFARRARQDYPQQMPSGLALITGPSKTADIEQTLSVGVHGPGEIHVLLLKTREHSMRRIGLDP